MKQILCNGCGKPIRYGEKVFVSCYDNAPEVPKEYIDLYGSEKEARRKLPHLFGHSRWTDTSAHFCEACANENNYSFDHFERCKKADYDKYAWTEGEATLASRDVVRMFENLSLLEQLYVRDCISKISQKERVTYERISAAESKKIVERNFSS